MTFGKLKTLAFALASLLCFACTKGTESVEERREVFTVSQSDTLHYSLGSFGDEEGASIQLQAAHFQTSELNRDINSGEVTYTYKADSTYTGSDYVELRSARGSNGASPNNNILITKLTITIE